MMTADNAPQSTLSFNSILELERLEYNLYRGRTEDIGFPQIYGGQVLGQAVMAASHTVAEDRAIHSLKGMFLRRGDMTKPVVYEVKNLRDGGSFSSRNIEAIQDGKPIFTMLASFCHTLPHDNYQHPMPIIPMPENFPSEADALSAIASKRVPARVYESWRKRLTWAIETRGMDYEKLFDPRSQVPSQNFWFRIREEVTTVPTYGAATLAYASDFGLLHSAILGTHTDASDTSLQLVSIDHCIWFHQPYIVHSQEWFLYSTDTQWIGNSRAVIQGHIYSSQGVLIATTMQEGLVRYGNPDA